GREAGVDGRREPQPGRRVAGQVGEHADDLRTQVRIREAATHRLTGRIGQSDEGGEGPGARGGDLDAGASRATCAPGGLVARHAGDHHVAVGDVDALAVDDDEQGV